MKKSLLLFLVIVSFSSCTDDVKFNNPAFQTLKDNVFWRAINYNAYLGSNGEMIIEGDLGYEKIILQTESASPQIYSLGVNEISKATYVNSLKSELAIFSTGTNKGSGQIVITDYDAEAKTVSGTFRFSAVNANEENLEKPTMNFTEGVFYKVPLMSSVAF